MARELWNHTPALPLKTAPYWNWPLAPIRTVGHLMKSWKPYGTRFFVSCDRKHLLSLVRA